jgi:hypothetical protein
MWMSCWMMIGLMKLMNFYDEGEGYVPPLC